MIGGFVLAEERIKVVHGLHVEELNRTFKHASIVSNMYIRKVEVIFENAFGLIDDNSTALRVEGCYDAVLGQMYGQLNELSVHFLDCLVRVLRERIFHGMRHVLIHQHYVVAVLFSTPQVDSIFVRNSLQLVYFHPQLIIFLLVLEDVSLLNVSLADFVFVDLEYTEWELRTLHFMHKATAIHHPNTKI